jgi:hypothetical protein
MPARTLGRPGRRLRQRVDLAQDFDGAVKFRRIADEGTSATRIAVFLDAFAPTPRASLAQWTKKRECWFSGT